MKNIQLNNEIEMPQLGYGVFQVAPKRRNAVYSML